MDIWVIYDQKQYDHNKWFADRLTELFMLHGNAKLIIMDRLQFGTECGKSFFTYDGIPIEAPQIAACRTIFPLLSVALENAGTKVSNNSTVSRICNDKRLTYAILESAGVKMMKTAFYNRRFFRKEMILPGTCPISYPLILKTASGHGGSEVFMVDDADRLMEIVADLPEDSFLLQEVCRPYGQDLRVFVLGGRIVTATMRTAPGFRSNHNLGGVATLYELSESEQAEVQKVIDAFPAPLDLVGIDFLPHNGELIFNELEDVVGCRMIYETSDLDIATAYVNFVTGDGSL